MKMNIVTDTGDIIKTSIIIPTRNRYERLKTCIDSIEKNTKDYEIIVVCDGDEETYNKIKNNKHKKICNHVPQEYFQCINQGCSISSGDYIVYLADDVRVKKGWLEHAISVFKKKFDDFGLVGLKDDMDGGTTHAPHGLVSRNVLIMQGYLFPPSYKHYFGDTELSLRMQAMGRYTNTEKVVLFHDHKGKDKKFDDNVYSESFKKCWKSDEKNFLQRNPEFVSGLVMRQPKDLALYRTWWLKGEK